jgi:hypothetical protein
MPLIDLEEGGGGIQSFTGVIVETYFTENEYGLSRMVKSKFDDPENYVKFEDGCFTRYFPCGPGWTTSDGGETAVHESGPDKKFNSQTKNGQFLAALNSVPGIEDAVDASFSAYKASSLKGLHLTWGQVPVKKRKPVVDADGNDVLDASGKVKWADVEGATELLPVALGGQPAGQASLLLDVQTLGLSDEQFAAVVALAETAADDGKFIEGVAKISGLMAVQPFMAAVAKDVTAVRQAFSEPF